jgi:hypothetical protein
LKIQAGQGGAAYNDLLSAAQSWPLVFSDDFERNTHSWPTGDSSSSRVTLTRTIAGGKYVWDARAKTGVSSWVFPEMQTVTDFYLAVDAQQTSGAPTGEYGLIFRLSGSGDLHQYYLFEATKNFQFGIYKYDKVKWSTMYQRAPSSTLQANQPNRLQVIASGSYFVFYINGKYVARFKDATLTSGKIGLMIGLTNPNDVGTWEFDNLELRAP